MTTELKRIEDYLLDINIPREKGIPLEVYIAFPKTLTDAEERENVRKNWLNGNDKQVVAMELMFNEKLTAIFRPIGLSIDWKNLIIVCYAPSGLPIVIPNKLLSLFGETTEQRIASMNDYVWCSFKKEEDGLIAEAVVPLRGKISNDVAHEILSDARYTPLDLLLMGLGYIANNDTRRLFMPRLVTWFRGFDGKPMHVAQFTLPESGKTHFGILSEYVGNWKYIPEPPTLARLILDARTGILGEVFLRDGIIFDEFDKWTIDTSDRRYTFDSLLTGMEQGKWERGVSAMGVRAPDIPRLIPLLFFGNLGDFEKLYGTTTLCTRAWFTTIFQRRLTHDVSALADRFTLIDACFKKIHVLDYVTSKVLPHSVIRGIISEVQQNVKPINESRLGGRLKRHSNNLLAVLKALGVNVDGRVTDSMVAGTFEWDKWYIVTKEEKKEEKVPERE